MTAIPTTPEEATALVRDMVVAETTLEKLTADRDAEKTAIDEKYALRIQNAETTIKIITETLNHFADENPGLFEDYSTLMLDTHRIGYTPGKWKVETDEGLSDDDVIASLQRIIAKGEKEGASEKAKARATLARCFIRTKHEMDRKLMIDRSNDTIIFQLLTECGVCFTKTDSFFIRPDRKGQKPSARKIKQN